MPRFRYQASSKSGAPVFGSLDAETESELRQLLSARGLNLLHSTLLSFDASLTIGRSSLPRLAQLRLGAQLREALLTDLPAHQAVRAMAAEPFQHPLLALMPWSLAFAVLASLLAVLGTTLLAFSGWGIVAAVATLLLLALIWPALTFLLDTRPRRFLLRLADQLESGEQQFNDLLPFLPREVREVMRSATTEQCRARAVAELVPTLMGSRVQNHRVALTFIGTMLLAACMLQAIYAVLLFVVPGFINTFTDFGTSIPALTHGIARLSSMLESGGSTGFWISSLVMTAGILAIYALLTNLQFTQFLSTVPVVGTPFRWLMQARVARVLSAMIRHGSSGPDALRAATAASGFDTVRKEGSALAEIAAQGNRAGGVPRELGALPISLLLTDPSNPCQEHHDRPQSVAQSLTSFAVMLESASSGHGRLIGLFLQFLVIASAGIMTALIVVALFLPLIKLLNDLA